MSRRYSMLLLAATLSLSQCTVIKSFLVPPRDVGDPQASKATTSGPLIADLVLYVGRIHGAPAGETAIALRAGRVVARGTPQQVASQIGPGTRIVRQASGVLLPGFVDAHAHLDGASLLADAADLRKARTLKDVERQIGEATAGTWNDGDWLWGHGLSPELAAKLTMADLDRIAGNVPVWLSRADGHGALLNGALLKRLPADLVKATIAAGGRLGDTLARAARQRLPPVRIERWMPLLLDTLTDLQRQGLTEIQAMGATAGLRDALLQLEHEGRLPLRCTLFMDGELPEGQELLHPRPPPATEPGGLPATPPIPAWQKSRLVRVVGVKFWLDGTLGARSAALGQPYADAPETVTPLRKDQEVAAWIAAADQQGVQIALHAIGDAAVAQIVRVMTGLHRPLGAQPVRIEHARVIDPETLQQLAGKSVECSVQPLHAQEDAALAAARLGPGRRSWVNRAASLLRACPLLVGSDLPLSPAAPLAMWRALVEAQGGSSTDERLTAETALRALLPGGTASARIVPGPGDVADLVVWSRDPLEPGPPATVLAVVVDSVPTVLSLDDREVPD